MDQQKSRGKNIKVYDKIKIQHLNSGYRLHPTDYECRHGNASYNQGVGCHKVRDQTDWFVVLMVKNKQQNITYHFKYGDSILLSNVKCRKYLHASQEYESQISKNYEVSVCDNGGGSGHCLEDQWTIERASNTKDQYWSVGEIIKLKGVSCGGFLASHRRKLKDSGQNEVFAIKEMQEQEKPKQKGKKQDKEREKQREEEKERKKQFDESVHWIVSEIDPCLYSANITSQKKKKMTEEEEQLMKLKQIKKALPVKQKQSNSDTLQILKFGNERAKQREEEEKKVKQAQAKASFWNKFCCCCCCCFSKQDDYTQF